jgi:hypothetical protein
MSASREGVACELQAEDDLRRIIGREHFDQLLTLLTITRDKLREDAVGTSKDTQCAR